MTRYSPLAAVLVTLLSIASPAWAWNAAGHRLTAAIAWRCLDEATRGEVRAILATHPDYATWLKRARENDPGYAAFLEASTWPDDIKGDPRFHDNDDAPTPPLNAFPDMARHRHWHHVDHPLDRNLPRRPGNGELDRRLTLLQAQLADRDTSKASRAWALPWLIHLVGDAHQPLHVVSRYDTEGHGDDGGNSLWIENPFHPRRSSMNLHTYWDDLPGPPWLRGSRLEAAATRLLGETSDAVSLGSVEDWIREGRQLARDTVYAGLDGEVPTLSAEYHERARQISRQRITVAGQRLALLLRQLFSGH